MNYFEEQALKAQKAAFAEKLDAMAHMAKQPPIMDTGCCAGDNTYAEQPHGQTNSATTGLSNNAANYAPTPSPHWRDLTLSERVERLRQVVKDELPGRFAGPDRDAVYF